MSDRVAHIHLGASKLGLGLVVSITAQLGMEVHLVGRPGPEMIPRFGVSLVPSVPLAFHDVETFTGPESFEEAHPKLRSAVTRDGPLLITCTLRDGIVSRLSFLRELLAARGGGEALFIPCENSPHPAYETLRKEFEPKGVCFLDTVVNRICPKFIETSDSRRIVRAHKIGEWLIEDDGAKGIIREMLASSEQDVLFEKNLEPFERRKRWQVNGGQLLLALLAHQGGVKSLMSAAHTPRTFTPVVHFHSEVNRVLAQYAELSENLDFAMRHSVAFCEITDDVDRMVAMRRENLSKFFATFRARIAEPARLATELGGGETPEIFDYALAVLDQLLDEPRAYDWSSARAGLEPAVDQRAVEAYTGMLEGWKPADEIVARGERLEMTLSAHRSRFASKNNRIEQV